MNDITTPLAAPSPPNMETLTEFNSILASQALPQLYIDGHIDMAIEWGRRLDPFQKTTLKRVPEPSHIPGYSSPFPVYSSHYSSLFDVILAAKDQKSMIALCENPEIAQQIFTERIQSICLHCSKSLSHSPEFALFLFDQINPTLIETFKTNIHLSSSLSDDIKKLAIEALKHEKYDWLPKINHLNVVIDQRCLPGDAVLQYSSYTPLDIKSTQGIETLFNLGCFPPETLLKISRSLFEMNRPDFHDVALKLLDHYHQKQIESTQIQPGHPKYAQTYSNIAIFDEPYKTPPLWFSYFLDQGFDPFTDPTNGTIPPIVRLFGKPWVDLASRLPHDPELIRGRKARAIQEDALEELALLLIKKQSPNRDMHFDVHYLDKHLKSKWGNCRKIDLVALCVSQGYYKIASHLIESGSDWKFAAKQSVPWLTRRSRFEEDDTTDKMKAFFEALNLRKVSEKSTARRDAKNIQKLTELPPQPSRSTPRL